MSPFVHSETISREEGQTNMMRHRHSIMILIPLTLSLYAQREYIRWNVFDVNKVHTKFSNANQLCDGNFQNPQFAMPPAFEYPAGSGLNYGTCVAFVAGGFQEDAGGENPDNQPLVDAAMTEGPADYWDPDHYDPYKAFVNGDRASMSDDPESWPVGGYQAALPNYYYKTTADYVNDIRTVTPGIQDIPLLLDESGWPGFGPNGKQIGEQESFTVSYAIDHLAEVPPERWMTLQVQTRGLAWSGKYYEDFIVWVFVGRNLGHTPIIGTYFGVWSDYSFLASFNPPNLFQEDADACYYDRARQFAYSWDVDGIETSPTGATLQAQDIAWAGTIVLKTPSGDDGQELGVTTYDAVSNYNAQTSNFGNGARKNEFYYYNLVNKSDPRDTDDDGICDTFDGLDYFVDETEPTQIMASGPFTLEPGEMDTLIIATVFGVSKLDLFKNADQVIQLYKDNWQVIEPPPMPSLEVVPGDRQVELIWDRKAETDPDFEGYRIYKSADNGVSWGQPIIDLYGDVVAYKPMEIFDIEDGVTGVNNLEPYFSLGTDSGLEPIRKVVDGDTVNYFLDTKCRNGYEYIYAVTSYTRGGASKAPIENAIATDASKPGDNTASVIPNRKTVTQTLDDVRVVPNPYVATAQWEMRIGERRVDFTNLPETCTIRIYNISGELVRTLEHTGGQSTLGWDLLSDDNQEVAAGLYFYHIESNIGETQGKFVIIY